MTPSLLTIKEVATLLNLHPDTVRRLIHQKKLPATRLGNRWIIRRDTVDRWLSHTENSIPLDYQAEQLIHMQATLLENVYNPIFVWDLATGVIHEWYPGAARMYGWSTEEAVGCTVYGLLNTIPSVDFSIIEHSLRSSGQWEGDLIHITRDGEQFSVQSKMVLVPHHTDGTLVLEIDRNRTIWKNLAERAQALQQITSALLETLIPEEVADVVLDQTGAVLGSTTLTLYQLSGDGQTLEMISRRNLSEASYREFHTLSLHDHQPIVKAVREQRVIWLETAEEHHALYPQHSARLRETGLETTICLPMLAKGQAVGGMTVSFSIRRGRNGTDETFLQTLANQCALALERANLYQREQQARARAEAADQLKLRFLGMISHELRTPLTSIKGFITTLLAEDVEWSPEQQRQFLTIADEETDNLTNLVEQLLDLSRIQAGALSIFPETRSLAQIVDSVQPTFSLLTAHRPFTIDLPTDLPPVRADFRRVVQVLVNLVGNAAKYSPAGGAIHLRAHRDGDDVQIDVTDQGEGIPPAERIRVFEPFRQLARKNSGQLAAGAGLGLAICKGLVEAHGGRIWIQDTPAPGMTISFTLPISQ